ncbi:GNAT family N-acetyltransferase [Streptomyces tricolor]|uniref:GNAT family N-acetyltransferase n=1 Tax=Streptomyces tricolor TaxID=68277 RepID=UPI000D1C4076
MKSSGEGKRQATGSTSSPCRHYDKDRTVADPRPARPDDAFEIARLRSELILSEPWTHPGSPPAGTSSPPDCTPEATPGPTSSTPPTKDSPAAPSPFSSRCSPPPKYPKGLAARIHAVAAEPSYRRRGYAKAALATLLEHLEQHSVTRYERPCTKGSVSGPTPR